MTNEDIIRELIARKKRVEEELDAALLNASDRIHSSIKNGQTLNLSHETEELQKSFRDHNSLIEQAITLLRPKGPDYFNDYVWSTDADGFVTRKELEAIYQQQLETK